jgi:hypothetical protein
MKTFRVSIQVEGDSLNTEVEAFDAYTAMKQAIAIHIENNPKSTFSDPNVNMISCEIRAI